MGLSSLIIFRSDWAIGAVAPEIIARAVWLYYRFPLSLRHVEEMLLERGGHCILRDYPPMGQKPWSQLRPAPGFRSIESLQYFVSLFSAVRNLFVPDHTKPSARQIRNHRLQAMAQWKAVSGHLV